MLLISRIVVLSVLLKESLSFVILPGTKKNSLKTINTFPHGSSSQVNMVGMGMGSKVSKKKSGGKKKNNSSGGSSFDVAKATLKSEKLYDELLKEANRSLDEDHQDFGTRLTSEYIIAARLNPNNNESQKKNSSIPGSSSIGDWVPVAQLCLSRPVEDDDHDVSSQERERLSHAISSYCREISYVATLGSSLFKSIPRNLIQYSAEDIDSFYKFVYEDVIEGKNNDAKNDNVMTKAEARTVLHLAEDTNDLAEIKQSYRKLSMKLHPDRFVGVERSAEEEDETNRQFAKVKIAYETLQSGIRVTTENNDGKKSKSWYESLGGRARTDFIGSIELISIEKAKEEITRKDYKCAIAGLNPETVMAFVTRNQMAA